MKAMTVAATSLCLVLVGCNKAAEQRADEIGARVEQTTEAAGAKMDHAAEVAQGRIDNAIDRMGAAITPVSTPQEFANAAARSDAYEIQAAQLATKNSSSAEVKAFAQEMIKAHTDSTAKIKGAASAAKIAPDATLSNEQTGKLAKLGKLTGPAFDEEYLDEQVDAHEKALALMKSFAADGTDAVLKSAAGEIAPVVEKHLAHARDLDRKTDR